MFWSKPARLIVATIGAAIWLSPNAVYGDEPQHYFAEVTCDSAHGTLSVEEDLADTEAQIPSRPGVQSLTALTRVETIKTSQGDERDLVVPRGSFITKCELGTRVYRIEINPWKNQERVSGECGGDPPTLRLVIQRSGKQLIDLVYGGYCNDFDAVVWISKITLHEKEMEAEISGNFGSVKRRYADLPHLDRISLAEPDQLCTFTCRRASFNDKASGRAVGNDRWGRPECRCN